MRRVICLLASSIFAFSVCLLRSTPVHAAEPAVKIGIFDVQKIIQELSLEAPVKGKIEPPGPEPAKEEAGKLSSEIRRLRKELEQEGLSEERRNKMVEERNRYRAKLRAINEKAGEAAREQWIATEEEIIAAVTRYGEEKGFTILLGKTYWTEGDAKNGLIFPGKVVDISQDIVRRLKAEAQRGDAKKDPQKKSATVPSTKP